MRVTKPLRDLHRNYHMYPSSSFPPSRSDAVEYPRRSDDEQQANELRTDWVAGEMTYQTIEVHAGAAAIVQAAGSNASLPRQKLVYVVTMVPSVS